ncbi:hypothetical protein ABGB17_02350 [Sphaerisporangium sp. B11E5]|uniref:hypothetical protein n=1 Tax=Sphaerisporangium sp. B11E5 TaxID=3153563 RepID=UPI00325DF9BF
MRRRVVARCCCLALIFLVAACAVYWVRYRSPLYQTSVTVAFVTKTSKFQGEVYGHFTDNHIYMALATERYFDNPGTLLRLRKLGGTAKFDYKVAHWGNQELPVYGQPYASLQALSDDPQESKHTLDLALRLLTQKLNNLQTSAGADGRVMIKWEPIGDIIGPQRQGLQRGRSQVGIALLAVLSSAAVIAFTRDRNTPGPGSGLTGGHVAGRRPVRRGASLGAGVGAHP